MPVWCHFFEARTINRNETVLLSMNKITVRHFGVVLEITRQHDRRFIIPDYTTGERVRHVRTTESEAREKAKDVCKILAKGRQQERGFLGDDDLKFDARRALEILQPTGLRLMRAAQVVADCCELITVDEIVAAARYWKDHRPDRKFAPKPADLAVDEFLGRQKHLSDRRQRALKCYLDASVDAFKKRTLDTTTAADLRDFMRAKKEWKSAKTKNEVRNAISLLYIDAAERGYVAKNFNPAKEIKAERLKNGDAGIMLPSAVRQILYSVEDELKVPLAVWFFAGCRKESIARLQWSALQDALKTAFIQIKAIDDLKTGARSVPLEENLRLWICDHLSRHAESTGPILPTCYSEGRKLDNLTRKIACRSGIKWVDNAPRHSYVTMRLAKGDNVQSVAKATGNSLSQIQKHYWNRNEAITEEIAGEYFGIVPAGLAENVTTTVAVAHGEKSLRRF